MTTLSKEDVVRWADECVFDIMQADEYHAENEVIDSGNRWITDKMMAFATIARADLVAENERLNNDLLDALDCKQGKGPTALAMVIAERDELLAENGRLRNELLNSLGDVIDAKESMSLLGVPRNIFPEMHKAMCQQLTATRTALAAAEVREEKLRDEISLVAKVADSKPIRDMAKEVLAKPRDDSALREMIAGVYAECAKACRKEAVVIVVDGKEERAYNNAVSDCGRAIRALAKKARHGS